MTNTRWNLALLGSASLLAMAAAPHPVFAQSAAAQPVPTANAPAGSTQLAETATQPTSASLPANSNQLGEVIVTAEKRETTLQKTAIDVQVVTPDVLSKTNVKDIAQLSKVAPSVQFYTVAAATAIQVRGLRSTSLDFADESPNAVHIDGIYLPNSRELNGLFYDLQRVEVLPGPQGTLFGRNAAAGAVNIITQKPTFTAGGYASVDAGSYGLLDFRAAGNMPINDTLAIRIAGMHATHSGYFTTNGLDDMDQTGARLHVLWEPDNRQTLLVSLDQQNIGGRGVSAQVLAPNTAQTAPPSASPITFPIPPDVRDNSSIYGLALHSRAYEFNWGAAGNYTYRFDPATLTIQASNRETHYRFDNDQPAGNYGNSHGSGYHQSVEARLTSNSTMPLQWVGGLYYFHDKSGGILQTYAPNASLIQYITVPGTTTNAWAAFGQATYTPDFLPQLHLTAGGRYNSDVKRGTGAAAAGANLTVSYPALQTLTYNKFTYKVNAAFDFTPRNMIYATLSTGYKAGGFVYGVQPIALPQNITAYEIGSKNRFLDNRLQVNLDAYRYDYVNFEQTYGTLKLVSGAPVVLLNVASTGTARVLGADVEVVARATADDSISINAAYLHARFLNLDLSKYLPGPGNDYSGRPLGDTPPWTVTASYAHTFHLAHGALEASGFVRYVDRRAISVISTGLVNNATVWAAGYETLDLALRYTQDGGKWYVQPYVNNLTNTVPYYAGGFQTTGVLQGRLLANIGAPRTFGVLLGANF